ncbi:hypothetical protein V7O66_02185 [Methanolobus sp. ZRKC3]|uniref:hypothetical protein n=1 Tax=Methanolobus sp. ZRKC3 TaxID=3125786 RepID=UPI0032509C43
MILPKSKNILILIFIFLISTSLGCLETPVATPALIDEDALTAYGWSQAEDIQYNTFEQELSNSTNLTFNSTVVTYRNDRLASDIEAQAQVFRDEYRLPSDVPVPMLKAVIITNRITLPGKANVPSELIAKILESSIEDANEQNSVESFNESSKMQLTADNGAAIHLSTFTGSTHMENSSLRILGFVALIESQDSSTIVYGMVPNGTFPVNIGPLEADLFSIDGEKELNEMIELIKTID